MAAHRYWRFTCTDGSRRSIIELEYRTSPGGSDVTVPGGTITWSSNSTLPGSDAFDNDWATGWYTNDAQGNFWTVYDFGSGNEKNIIQFTLSTGGAYVPQNFKVEYSDDNSSWTTLKSFTETLAFSTTYTYDLIDLSGLAYETVTEGVGATEYYGTDWPGGHQYWRINILSAGENFSNVLGGGTQASLKDVLLKESVTDAGNYNLMGAATAKSSAVGASAASAISGSGWVSFDNDPFPQWWQYNFTSGFKRWITHIDFDAVSSVTCPIDFEIQYSDDGSSWTVSSIHAFNYPYITENPEIINDGDYSNYLRGRPSPSDSSRYAESYDKLLSDVLSLADLSGESKSRTGTIIEGVDVLAVTLADYIYYLVEGIGAEDTTFTMSTLGIKIEEIVSLESLIRISFLINAIEQLTLSDNPLGIREAFLSISESSELTSILSSLLLANGSGIQEGVTLSDLSENLFLALILETINTSSAFLPSLLSKCLLDDGIEVPDALLSQLVKSVSPTDQLTLLEGTTTVAFLSGKLEDYLTFSISTLDPLGEYEGWTYNPESKAVTNYSLNFSELTSYKNNFYLASNSGLYMLEGSRDGGDFIQSRVTTAGLNFGKRTEKQVPQVFLGVGGSELIVTVSVDERSTAYYSMKSLPDDGLSTKTLKLGKGLIGNTWQFSIMDVNSDSFDLDSLEFFPVFLKRKHR